MPSPPRGEEVQGLIILLPPGDPHHLSSTLMQLAWISSRNLGGLSTRLLSH